MKSITISIPSSKEEVKKVGKNILGRISSGLKKAAVVIDNARETA